MTHTKTGSLAVGVGLGLGVLAFLAGAFTGTFPVEAGFVAGGAAVALLFVVGFGDRDVCPGCDESVDASRDRYCSACGTTLESLPYRPTGLDDVEDADDGRVTA